MDLLLLVVLGLIIGGGIGSVIADDNGLTKWQGFRWGFFFGPFGFVILFLIVMNERGKQMSKALQRTNDYLDDIREI